MEEMLATLPRVVSVSAVSGGCLTALDPSAPSQGTQGGGGGGGGGAEGWLWEGGGITAVLEIMGQK